jgi:hypothetical protein
MRNNIFEFQKDSESSDESGEIIMESDDEV